MSGEGMLGEEEQSPNMDCIKHPLNLQGSLGNTGFETLYIERSLFLQ